MEEKSAPTPEMTLMPILIEGDVDGRIPPPAAAAAHIIVLENNAYITLLLNTSDAADE